MLGPAACKFHSRCNVSVNSSPACIQAYSSALIHSGQPAHTVTALTLYRLQLHTPSAPSLTPSLSSSVSACLRTAGLSSAVCHRQHRGSSSSRHLASASRGLWPHTARFRYVVDLPWETQDCNFHSQPCCLRRSFLPR